MTMGSTGRTGGRRVGCERWSSRAFHIAVLWQVSGQFLRALFKAGNFRLPNQGARGSISNTKYSNLQVHVYRLACIFAGIIAPMDP